MLLCCKKQGTANQSLYCNLSQVWFYLILPAKKWWRPVRKNFKKIQALYFCLTCKSISNISVVNIFDYEDHFCTGENIQFRLSDRWYGKVEVKYDSEWGRVCNADWDDMDASVVCKQLGYVDGRKERNFVSRPQGQGYVRMNEVNCNGDERSILECKHKEYWKPVQLPCNDATVVCNVTSKYLSIFLFVWNQSNNREMINEWGVNSTAVLFNIYNIKKAKSSSSLHWT